MSKTNAKQTNKASKIEAKATTTATPAPEINAGKRSKKSDSKAPAAAKPASAPAPKGEATATRYAKSAGLSYAERVAELKSRISRALEAKKIKKDSEHPNYATLQNLLKMTKDEIKRREELRLAHSK